jgi:hypothetical protein
MEQQTAVEFLISQIVEDQIIKAKSVGKWEIVFQKAKEIEKEYIINANRDGVDMCVKQKPFITGEEYYKKTFKTK